MSVWNKNNMGKKENKIKQKKGIAFNVSMLYIMNIAKLVFPLITLPYLTRVLSVECYGIVAYVKATMVYAQLFVDFGFMLSGVRSITEARDDLQRVGEITGNVVMAKGMLSVASFIVILSASFFIDILRENLLYTILAFIPIALSTLLLEFLFRGLELMHIIAIRYVIMKTISVSLTLVLVKGNGDILWIPILDILSSVVAIILTLWEVKKLGIKISFVESIKGSWNAIRVSGMYFVSDAATTIFGAFNTILVGIFMNETDVAFWAVCLQLVSAVRAMYTPINNGIYPQMIKSKNINLIKRIISIFLPIVVCGCLIVVLFAEQILVIAGSAKYAGAAPVMRCLVPVLLFSFPAMLFGWPTLGAIGKVKETTKTTLSAAAVQLIGLGLLIVTDNFEIMLVALTKSFTELCLMIFRIRYCRKFRDEFVDDKREGEDMHPLQGVIIKITNPIGAKMEKIEEQKKNVGIAIACVLLYGMLMLWYSVNMFDIYVSLAPRLVLSCVVLAFLILCLMDGRQGKVQWKVVFPICWILCGFLIIAMGIFYRQNLGYWLIGPVIGIGFPCYYYVMYNSSRSIKVIEYLCKSAMVFAIIYLFVCFASEFISDTVWAVDLRYNGTTSDANRIGEICVAASVCAVYMLLCEKNKTWRIITIIAEGIVVGQAILSQSRSTLLAMLLLAGFYVVIVIKDAVYTKDMKNFGYKAIAAVLVIVLGFSIISLTKDIHNFAVERGNGAPAADEYNIELFEANSAIYAMEAEEIVTADNTELDAIGNRSEFADGMNLDQYSSGRIGIWKTYLSHSKLIEGNPCDGKTPIDPALHNVAAHNTILELAYRSGIITAILFFITEFMAGIYILRVMFRRNDRNREEDYFVALATIGYIIVSNLQVAYNPITSIIFFVYAMSLTPLFKKNTKKLA